MIPQKLITELDLEPTDYVIGDPFAATGATIMQWTSFKPSDVKVYVMDCDEEGKLLEDSVMTLIVRDGFKTPLFTPFEVIEDIPTITIRESMEFIVNSNIQHVPTEADLHNI